MYEVVIMRSSPPWSQNSLSSSMKRRRPLHLIKETSMSILSAEAISFFSSLNICGSCRAPVKRELCATEVSGRIQSFAFFPAASFGSFSFKTAKSCSALDSISRELDLSAEFLSSAII